MRFVILTALLALAALGAGFSRAAAPSPGAASRTVSFRTQTMGTIATLQVATADSAAVAESAYRALLSLHHTDSLMTNWTTTSEVARINREAAGRTVTVAPAVNGVLALAAAVGRASDGAFDITVEPLVRLWGFLGGEPRVPAAGAITAVLGRVGWRNIEYDPAAARLRFLKPDVHLDLGGIAKGHGVDVAAGTLTRDRLSNFLLDLSGNMIARGSAAPDRSGWTIGIRDPAARGRVLGTLHLRDAAVATSGNYLQFVPASDGTDSLRYGHILDPRTGWPAQGMASATVIAPSAALADAWATALIVAEPATARSLAQRHPELNVILAERRANGQRIIWVEDVLRADFRPSGTPLDSLLIRYF